MKNLIFTSPHLGVQAFQGRSSVDSGDKDKLGAITSVLESLALECTKTQVFRAEASIGVLDVTELLSICFSMEQC